MKRSVVYYALVAMASQCLLFAMAYDLVKDYSGTDFFSDWYVPIPASPEQIFERRTAARSGISMVRGTT
jgi:hypothetical protein